MNHRCGLKKLGRTFSHRRALLRNQATSLLRHGSITTTLPKAKELRRYVEPLITLAKKDDLARRRQAARRLFDQDVVRSLFSDIGPRYLNRPGGYTRIIKLPARMGDAAPMGRIELVED